jgi:hypothetical protein
MNISISGIWGNSVEWHSIENQCSILLNTYRVSQEERAKFREIVPFLKVYRYNPEHLYLNLNGYRDNCQRSLKLWQLLHTYWLPNTYLNWQEYVVSVMLISVLNIKLPCEWHKAIKKKKKNTRTCAVVILWFRSTMYTWHGNAERWSLTHGWRCILVLVYDIATKIQGLISRHKRCTMYHIWLYRIIIIYKCGPCPVFYELYSSALAFA